MTATIKIEIDGEWLDRSQCMWLKTSGCGCISGVALAAYYPLDADEAWLEFEGGRRAVTKQKKLGCTFEMRPRAELPKPDDWGECPHTPKWGDPSSWTPPADRSKR